ncbi:MAG: TfoX/Sxy family protein [Microgenomates group bacterium]
MSTKSETVEYILEQLSTMANIRTRKMFGEYALYCDEKVVALICDDELFVKSTISGKEFAGNDFKEGIPYPGAKIYIKVDEKLDDREWLSTLIRITTDALPLPK